MSWRDETLQDVRDILDVLTGTSTLFLCRPTEVLERQMERLAEYDLTLEDLYPNQDAAAVLEQKLADAWPRYMQLCYDNLWQYGEEAAAEIRAVAKEQGLALSVITDDGNSMTSDQVEAGITQGLAAHEDFKAGRTPVETQSAR